MSGIFNYKFKTVSDSDFEIALTSKASNRIMTYLFNKTKEKMRLLGKFDLGKITKFPVDPRYYSFIKTTLTSQLREISIAVGRDKIKMLNSSVNDAYFERDADDKDTWIVHITVGGQYLDDRLGQKTQDGN